MMHMNDFMKQKDELIATIEHNQENIIDSLTKYEPYTAAKDEVERSLLTLKGLEKEFAKLKSNKKAGAISTFFPINLPLYSLVLFAVAPSYFTDTVHVRVSGHISDVVKEIAEILDLAKLFPAIKLRSYGRKKFSDECVKISDVILFCGRYENALAIRAENPEALFIYNGSGINPAIVTSDADMDLAVDKIVEMRTFNSGQDCAGTDCIFVEKSMCDTFLKKLQTRLSDLKTGQYGDRSVDIGPILRSDYVKHLSNFLDDNQKYIIKDGAIDKNIVSPFVIKKDISEHSGEFTELFAPVFYVLTYDNLSQVTSILDENRDSSMYVSLFSKQNIDGSEFKRLVKIAQILRNQIVNDVEYGNSAYGGYGERANFVAHNSEITVKPVLISREIDKYLTGRPALKSDKMSVTMLGSGCWEGTPAPFCRCNLCRTASKNTLSIENRTRPGFHVRTKEAQFVMEIGPDFRTQTARFNLPKIKDYLVSHWHNDHLFGVFDLHFYAELVLKDKINIYCSKEVAHYIQEHIGYMPINVIEVKPFNSFYVGDIKITPFPVYHMHNQDDAKKDSEIENVFGFLLEHNKKQVAYLADYYKIPDKSLELIRGIDVVIADGTYLFEEKWPNKSLQNMTITENDPDHLHGSAITKLTESLHAKKVVYHSISHLPGLSHDKLQNLLPDGQLIGFDGIEVL